MDKQESADAAEPIVPPVAEPVRGAHIYCPHCDYDLTGAPTNRCPECGNEFDRAKLAAWLHRCYQPLPAEGFLQLARMSLFDPRRLAREMPAFPSVGDATEYARWIRFLALLILAFGVPLIIGEWDAVLLGVQVGVITAACSRLCELLTAGVLGLALRTRPERHRSSPVFWRTVTTCFSAHLLLSCGAFLLALAVIMLFRFQDDAASITVVIGVSIPFACWWYGLGQAVSARAAPTAGRLLAIVSIPVIGLSTIGLGAVIFQVACAPSLAR